MPAEKSPNLQDAFLNHVRKQKVPVTIFLVNGVKLARRIIGHPAFSAYEARERAPGESVTDDEELADYVRQSLVTVHHPGSTCRMGPLGEDTVVDHELKVHGLSGLRVADASIYPRIVGGNTNASVVAIAEKVSDMMLGVAAPAPIPLPHGAAASA